MGGEHISENVKFDVCVDWDALKIREHRNVLPAEGGKHIFETMKFDLHCIIMENNQNRKCAPHRWREALF